MPLSEQEKRTLEQLEAQLAAEDPRFASAMGADPQRARHRRRLLLGAVMAGAGTCLLVLAVALHQVPVGVLGFTLIVVGVAYAAVEVQPQPHLHSVEALTAQRAPRVHPSVRPHPGFGASSSPAKHGNFLATLEARWERRRYENQGW